MKLPVLVRSAALLIAAAGSMFCADAIRWGTAVDGVQLGILAISAPEPGLRIALKNTSTVAQEIPIGFEDHDPLYNVRFTVRIPRGDELAVYDLNTLRDKPSDIGPGPIIFAWLQPGGVQEFHVPVEPAFRSKWNEHADRQVHAAGLHRSRSFPVSRYGSRVARAPVAKVTARAQFAAGGGT